MSDYDKGFRGEARDEDTNYTEYSRGEQDRVQGQPWGGGGRGGMDLSKVRAAAERFGDAWRADPRRALAAMIKEIIGYTILGGVIGTVLGLLLGDTWTMTGALTWGINGAYLVFWFDGMINASMLLGAWLTKRTARGGLVLLILVAALVYMGWFVVLGPAFSAMF